MNKLKNLRKARNLSLRDMSKLTGVSFSYLWKLESGNASNPREGIKILISRGLKVPVRDLFS